MRNPDYLGRDVTTPPLVLLPPGLAGQPQPRRHFAPLPRRAGLGTLIDAGLVAVGDHLEWNGHTATVCPPGGALVHGTELRELGGSAVSALAASLATPGHRQRLAPVAPHPATTAPSPNSGPN